MKIDKIPLSATNYFPPIFLDYCSRNEVLNPFIQRWPDVNAFEGQMALRRQKPVDREVLYHSLVRQYGSMEIPVEVKSNLERLREPDCFTVVTGHQLNIFTGPLYFIYKIVACINAARALSSANPGIRIVPVYWMASEDHDSEEIDHFRLFGKTYRWQHEQQGPVGRFDTAALAELLKSLPEPQPLFEKAYLHHRELATATRYIVNELFGREGLVIIDGDDRALKARFTGIMADDLIGHSARKKVEESNAALAEYGYKAQIFARDINLFYMDAGIRDRIVEIDDGFELASSTDIKWTRERLLDELEEHPERFSPNVVLRPLYQEILLPNLAYVGGPAEIAYWLQLKSTFDHYMVPFPVLLPRNFALIVSGILAAKLDRLHLKPVDLFEGFNPAKAKVLRAAGVSETDLGEETSQLKNLFSSIQQKAEMIDPSLTGFIAAEQVRMEKALENIAKRILKAEEQKQETGIRQLETIVNRLFPDGELQERTDNFLNFYINDQSFIMALLEHFDPFDFRFNVMIGDV